MPPALGTAPGRAPVWARHPLSILLGGPCLHPRGREQPPRPRV